MANDAAHQMLLLRLVVSSLKGNSFHVTGCGTLDVSKSVAESAPFQCDAHTRFRSVCPADVHLLSVASLSRSCKTKVFEC